MAQSWPSFLVYVTLVLSSSSLHVSSLRSPISNISTLSELNDAADRIALLSFRSMLSSNDRRGPLESWNDSIHFCQWSGVTCGDGLYVERVISLELSSLSLAGSISPAISNLTFLGKIDLSNNQIHGPIPKEIGSLFMLQHLNLSVNSLGEGIPDSLSNCSNLQAICLDRNMLQGEIPPLLSSCLDLRIISLRNNRLTGNIPLSLTNLTSLSVLSMGNNNLTGVIPPTIGNIHSLTVFDLSENHLSEGIPSSMGKLLRLTQLDLSFNRLSGDIPTSLWNISSLSYLFMTHNNLSGFLPSNTGHALPLLERIYLYNNHFLGHIPMSLANASRLEIIDLSNNMFVGTIPANLGSLRNLQWLNLRNNQLEAREPYGWSFLTALSNCTGLEKLELDSNGLGGALPTSIANFSTKLQKLTVSNNEISGSIPLAIGNLIGLTTLDMGRNLLKGSIPASIGNLKKMHALDLSINKLSGEVPSTLGNLTWLLSLSLESNRLSGTIPPSLGYCQNLILLDLSVNRLTGGIPKEILTIRTLSLYLSLAKNLLTGEIPSEVGKLINLGKIDFSMNQLSGALPSSLRECLELGKLYLDDNFFHGKISSLSALRGMQELDLSKNNLSGQIPYDLQTFRFLYYINLSFNNFDGEVPRRGIFTNANAASVIGNTKLCGGNPILYLPPCPFQSSGKNHRFTTLTVIFWVFCILTWLFLFFYLGKKLVRDFIVRMLRYGFGRQSRRESTVSTHNYKSIFILKDELRRISYAQLMRATNGFSTDNLIGVGSFGAVYKGTIIYHSTCEVFTFAVKVLNLQQRGASKSFMTECDVLTNMKHRNILRIYTTCSSVDSMGNDFKAIVLGFMANGSLDDWLHPIGDEQHKPKRLNLIQRINIAIDVASALDYIHHNDWKPIVHCDIKPGNILLDGKMNARVGDFGLARAPVETLIRSSVKTTTSVGCRGTTGYLAPEYGTANRVSTKGDVYSYGILLLELFTGKRPTDDIFIRGLNLKKYVEMALPERVLDVIDENLLSAEANDVNNDAQGIIECVPSLFRIGVSCSNELSSYRPEMRDIIGPLRVIRDVFLAD